MSGTGRLPGWRDQIVQVFHNAGIRPPGEPFVAPRQ
jgi:hypothetical protein